MDGAKSRKGGRCDGPIERHAGHHGAPWRVQEGSNVHHRGRNGKSAERRGGRNGGSMEGSSRVHDGLKACLWRDHCAP